MTTSHSVIAPAPLTRARVAGFALILFASPLFAVDSRPTEARWYEIELLVFRHNSLQAENSENWPDQSRLRYPSALEQLRDPPDLPSFAEATREQELELETSDEVSVFDSDVLAPTLAPILEQSMDSDTGFAVEEGGPEAREDSAIAATDGEEELSIDPKQTVELTAFERLGEDRKALKDAWYQLRRRSAYTPLFHEVWRQPLTERDKAVSLRVTGGDRFDRHFELDGSIRVSVERYLHVDTNLWLSRFQPNFGQGEALGSHLPAPPQFDEERSAAGQDDDFDRFVNDLIRQQYLVEKVFVMDESRRMRSNERHYLDHPMFGLLIEVRPVELETAEGF